MSSPRRHAVLAMLVALAVPAHADSADPVAVRAGTASLTAGDVQSRLASVPAFQLRTFGATPAEARRRFVDSMLVPELLFAEYARETKLADVPHVRFRLREALERALGDSLLAEAAAAGVPDDELRAYYDAHRDDYQKPERIRIARILVDDEALAKRIIAGSTGTAGFEHWKDFARESSLDTATKLRGGMLGFVHPTGHTDVPQVDVDPALYAAAAKVRDGELVAAPVKEGAHLAVVWRRGSLPATSRPFEAERDAIRAILVRERAERAFATLREGLRQQSLKDENPALLEALAPESPPAAPARPVASTEAASASARPIPEPSERGLR